MIHAIRMGSKEYRQTLESLATRLYVPSDRDYRKGDKIKISEFTEKEGYTKRESVFEILGARKNDLGQYGKMTSIQVRLITSTTRETYGK